MDEVAAAVAALERFTTTYRAAPPPVDVAELAGSLYRLRVRDADDLDAAPGAPADVPLSGLLLPHRYEVWVRRDEPRERRRFSVAHEVGHFVLHALPAHAEPVFCRPADVQADVDAAARRREREANRFAAELLMPEPLVRSHVERTGPDPTSLAPVFAVSDLAMGFRLVNLGYLEWLPPALDEARRRWQEGGA
jgi:hypothetical protein